MKWLPTLAFGLLSCNLIATAHAATLAKGQIAHYSFQTVAGKSYEIGYSTNSTCSNSLSKSCCALLINNSASQPSGNSFDHVVAAADNSVASLVIDRTSNGTVSAAVYAIEACNYNPPSILSEANTVDTLKFGTATGQLGNDYANVPTTQVNPADGFMLRDISRRTSMAGVNGNPNTGAMSGTGEISARRIFGYWLNRDYFLADNAKDSDNHFDSSQQGELADALMNSGKVYDYWRDVLGFNSYDQNGAAMHAQTNAPYPPVAQPFCGRIYPADSLYNAFWDGSEIVFTPRDFTDIGGNYYPHSLAAALDVTAHEWGHAISDRAVNLVYQRESGALNEAYSDWMGVAVEFANGEDNWTLGEGVETIRDLANPRAFNQPDTYKGTYWKATDTIACPTPDVCFNDYCGVHTNSGVPNKMFYLLANGGTHNNVTVTGIGVDTAIKIATDALHNYWTANEDFIGARAGMEAAAANYGADAAAQVALAWQAVGVIKKEEDDSKLSRFGSTGGGGGCAAGSGSPFDPTLWLLALIAGLGLVKKRVALARKRAA
ncbi:M4 family metallopeptidase [Simiduia curdlanivorans]|uniref:Neutral metalloproteinase n=1 Tax=Simiduia curdlanivorans TaxID=1492769 RepID=A0ABV8V5J9_9GAMM|nr:M4 family metallopeptidase [Simiduia curdlanivorans]MDN3641019.1 M4 family metallopeptidase [Simiduia curdlanivorans]